MLNVTHQRAARDAASVHIRSKYYEDGRACYYYHCCFTVVFLFFPPSFCIVFCSYLLSAKLDLQKANLWYLKHVSCPLPVTYPTASKHSSNVPLVLVLLNVIICSEFASTYSVDKTS